MDDAAQVRTLIERWAKAVHAGDLDAVLADHADDIVMFDVPPPEEGCAASKPIATPGRRSSSGSARAPASRSFRSTSPRLTTSPSRTPCSAAAPRRAEQDPASACA